MWCTTCQQDMPHIAHAASGRIVCSRCQRPMQNKKLPHNANICDEGLSLDEPVAAASTGRAPYHFDDWSARQHVRKIARELQRPGPTAASPQRIATGVRRFDPPHDVFNQLENRAASNSGTVAPQLLSNAAIRQRRTEGSQIVAWLIVVVGALALASGVGLIAWSLLNNQMMYWNLALGLALGGQGVLILGLVLVISRLWRSSRYAVAKLHEVHTRLGQLQQAAETLAATRSGGAPAFYADLVRGASPHVLLANLKGQVDQLATRVGSGW
jgi:hypothetical protein